jgi:hypothetical protein
MTDDEILAHQRAKHGDPYMPLSMAKKMQREEYKWARMSSQKRVTTAPKPCRYGNGTCLTHRRTE